MLPSKMFISKTFNANTLTEIKDSNIAATALDFFNKYPFTDSEIIYTPIKNIRRDFFSLETNYEGLCKIIYGRFYTDTFSLILDDLNKEDNLRETVMTGVLTRSAKATNTEDTIKKLSNTIVEAMSILKENDIHVNRIGDFIALTKAHILKPSVLFNNEVTPEYVVKNVTVDEAVSLLRTGKNLKTLMIAIITGMTIEESETLNEAPVDWVTALVSPELIDNKQFLIDILKVNVENAARAIRRARLAKDENLTVREMQNINQKSNNKIYGNARLIFADYNYHSRGWHFTVEGKNSDISNTYSYKYDSVYGTYKEIL